MSGLNSPKLELKDLYISVTRQQKPLNNGLISNIAKEIMNLNYRVKSSDDIVFTIKKQPIRPGGVYVKIFVEFNRILRTVGLEERKDGMKRRKVTLHSFRRFVYTTISDQLGKNYAENWLGHATSEYHVKKEDQKRELYATKCMKYLTFLDFEQLESTGKNIELRLEEKDRELAYLRDKDRIKEETLNSMADQLVKLTYEVQELKREKK